MANWQTEASVSNFDAAGNTVNTIGDRSAQRGASGVGTHTTGHLWWKQDVSNLEQSSVVGIDAGQVSSMREAIRTYTDNIINYVNGLNPEANANVAFKGEKVQESLTNYMSQLKTYCVNLVSQLLAFSDKLADVEAQWTKAVESMSTTVGTTSSDFAVGSKYQDGQGGSAGAAGASAGTAAPFN